MPRPANKDSLTSAQTRSTSFSRSPSPTGKLSTTSQSLSASPIDGVHESKLQYILDEIRVSEQVYLETLNNIYNHFYLPMKVHLKDLEMEAIFCNITDIRAFHTKFHSVLATVGNNAGGVGRAFLQSKSEFVVYGTYCSNMGKAQELIVHLSKEFPVFRNLEKECVKNSGSTFNLTSRLVVPMQRILKYPLLLRELKKYAEREKKDVTEIKRALEEMEDVGDYVNEVKRDSEMISRLGKLHSNISGICKADPGYLLKWGRLQLGGELEVAFKTLLETDTNLRKRHVFLFDKAMLITSTKDHMSFEFKGELSLRNVKLQPGPVASKVKGDQALPFKHRFYAFDKIFRIIKEDASVYTFHCKKKEDTARWVMSIEDCLTRVQPPNWNAGNHQFEYFTFKTPTECDVCGKLLKGLIFQGYKCCVNGAVAHKECIAWVPSIPKSNSKSCPPKY